MVQRSIRVTMVMVFLVCGGFVEKSLSQPVEFAGPRAIETVAPAAVNLSDLPARSTAPQDKVAPRMIRRHDLRSSEEIAALQEEALRLSPNDNVQLAPAPSGLLPSAPILGVNFAGMDINANPFDLVPPDPEMAAGPNHLIAVVNVSFEIYDKSGVSLVGPIALGDFMSSDPNCSDPADTFDPNVLYDEKEDRFVLAIDSNGTHHCVAVSQTGDPTGAWNVYSFSVGSAAAFFDFPHAGIGEDAIFVGANFFSPFAFRDSRVFALDKQAMYAGLPATSLMVNLGSTNDTPQPMNAHGWLQGTWPADLKHYILTETGFNGADHTLWIWDGPFSGPNTFATVAAIDLNAATGVVAGFPVDVQQAGGGGSITANDWRPLDFEYRDGFGWTTMTIACNPRVGGTVDCVRWAQIDLATGAIGPQGAGVFSSNRTYRFFPDLAVNACGDMAIGYSKSTRRIFPSIWYTGRRSGSPPGLLQPEAELKAGEITYTAFDSQPRRWGDYTGMTIDPDGLTFWYLGEYSKNTGNPNGRWGTYIGSFSFTGCQ